MKMRAMVPDAFPKEDMANNFVQYRKRKAPIGAFQKGYDLNGLQIILKGITSLRA
jgi:hypothetical protein